MLVKEIPVRKRGEVVAYAKVDDKDYESLAQWRWGLMDNGYAVHGTNSQGRILMHRDIMGCVRGDGKEVDHINHDKLDNRRSNLRLVTREQNARNRRADSGSTSRHLGVSWYPQTKRWVASASRGGKRIHLGYYMAEEDAARAAREWRATHTPYVYEAAA